MRMMLEEDDSGKPWLASSFSDDKRKMLFAEELTMKTLRDQFREFMRMPCAKFQQSAANLNECTTKRDMPMRRAIPPRERLALALRFLATGESFNFSTVVIFLFLDW